MSGWVLVVEQARDIGARDLPHLVVTAEDFVARPFMLPVARQKIINLARSYAYQTEGYYVSLLAEARGHRVIPSVETILDLKSRSQYAPALPELEEALNRAMRGMPSPPRLFVAFGQAEDPAHTGFTQLLFDWFRAPALSVTIKPGEWNRVERIEFAPVSKLDSPRKAQFERALKAYTGRQWRAPKRRTPPRHSIAVLHDPREQLPPSSFETLKYWANVAARQGVEVEPIQKRDLARLAEFDALFIRETTSIRNHTYRFARRAMQEGMPVIDDPVSMIRCTNKIYQWERMTHAGLPVPPTQVISDPAELEHAADVLGLPVVVKIPDGSFGRGVRKADSLTELKAIAAEFFKETDLLIAQKFLPTQYDWRVGVLDGAPLFVCHYRMAARHWQIVHHKADGTAEEGRSKTFPLERVPAEVLDAGVRAARLIGDGFYGVDLKETPDGIFVIEVNDNPNLEHGIEDNADRTDIWNRLTRWFTTRIDR